MDLPVGRIYVFTKNTQPTLVQQWLYLLACLLVYLLAGPALYLFSTHACVVRVINTSQKYSVVDDFADDDGGGRDNYKSL